MKVSYIIMPFEDAEYLIRCVNSLYRQLGEDYEVILAENVLDEKSLEFLAEKPQVKRISEAPQTVQEKLSKASSLLGGDCGYVQLLSVNTVVSPIMSRAVLACEKSDLIVPAVAVRKSDEFVVDAPETDVLFKILAEAPPQRFCFGRELFCEIAEKKFENFSSFILMKCTENISIKMLDEVCAYAERDPESTASMAEVSLIEFAGKISYIHDGVLRFSAANMIMDELLTNMDEEKHSALCTLCGKCGDDILLNKLFEEKSGCGFYEFAALDLDEYRLLFTGQSRAFIDDARVQIGELKKAITELEKKAGSLKIKAAIPAAQPAAVMSNPAVEVPKMYYEGRLGLKTIWRSFCGWLKYKLGGKR